jgi:hypothetical protein
MPKPVVAPTPQAAPAKAALTPLVGVTPFTSSQDILTGTFWSDGQEVTASELNNMVNNATIQPTFFSGKAIVPPIKTDTLMILQGNTGQLKQSTISAVVTSANPLVDQNFFFAGPATGFSGTPSFRAIKSKDIVFPTQGTTSNNVDWAAGNSFATTLTANTTFTFSNHTDGQTIRLLLVQGAGGSYLVTWPTITWRGFNPPTLTTAQGHMDIIILTKFSGTILGDYTLNYF